MFNTPSQVALVTLVSSLAFGSAQAAPTNLVLNGSFENGLTNWTHSGTTVSNPVVAINYGPGSPYPTGAYGEPVPAPNNASLSVDAPGTHGAYFVDDGAVSESLSQLVFLNPGFYRIGFDAYAPANGYSNPNDASFTAQIAGVTLANYLVSSRPSTTWLTFSGVQLITTAGFYNVSFTFNTPNSGAAKDVVIDRVYVQANVPEPESVALLGIALGAMAIARRRRKS